MKIVFPQLQMAILKVMEMINQSFIRIMWDGSYVICSSFLVLYSSGEIDRRSVLIINCSVPYTEKIRLFQQYRTIHISSCFLSCVRKIWCRWIFEHQWYIYYHNSIFRMWSLLGRQMTRRLMRRWQRLRISESNSWLVEDDWQSIQRLYVRIARENNASSYWKMIQIQ